jgi:hypothetical protein
MPRREPFTQTEVYARRRVLGKAPPGELPSILGAARPGESPSDSKLHELAEAAGVAASKRAAFITDVRAEIRLYRLNMLAMRQEEPSRQAETLSQILTMARGLKKALDRSPDALRSKVEPNMIGLVATRTGRLPRGLHMPGFDTPLAALIRLAEAERARQEGRVSKTRSRRLATHYRNDLALALKALAMTRSAKFAKDGGAAEKWAATVLDVLKVRYPKSEMRPADFRRMFVKPST